MVTARLVALGNVLFTKRGRVSKDLQGSDAWALVCSTTAARSAEQRAASRQRSPTAIDLIQAHGQVPFGGDAPCCFSPPKEVLELFVGVPDLLWNVEYMSALVVPIIMGLCGIMRRGFGFIKGLGAVLVMTPWISFPTGPALWTLPGGGPGYDHETRSIIQTRLCNRAQSRSQRVREIGELPDSRPREGSRPPSRHTRQEKLDTFKRKANG